MKAIFLDRDGVINPLIYNQEFGTLDSPLSPDEFKLLPRTGEGLRLINKFEVPVMIVSNQPAIAKGKISEPLFQRINQKMKNLLSAENCFINDTYYCLHHPEAIDTRYKVDCSCRKPKPGLLLQSAAQNNFDLANSFMVGDGLTDMAAGKSVGCKTILIGKEKCDLCRKYTELDLKPDYVAADLFEAAKIITSEG